MVTEKIKIRDAWIKDLDVLTGLLQELFIIETDFTPDVSRQKSGLKLLMKKPDAVILVAESGSDVVGMCTVQTVISTAEGGPAGLLEDLIVDRGFRRAGVGGALLKAAEEWAVQNDLTRLQLLTEKHNLPAVNFYLKEGWQPTDLFSFRKNLKTRS
jgi:ribosomal protein S18 acetylase RimI-like enzyme